MPLASPLRLPLLGALLGLHFATQAAPAAPAISFDTTPRAGQHQRQSMDIQAVMKMSLEAGPEATEEQRAKIAQAAANMSQMGAMKMAMQMQQTMKVGAAEADGWLPLTMTMASKGVSMEVGGKAVPLPANKALDMSFSARFNPQDFAFEMKKLDGASPEFNAALAQQGSTMLGESLQLFKALSQRPLKVGESVDVPLTMALPVPLPGGAGAMQGTVRYTLARVDKGVAHFNLGMDLKMDIDTPVPSKPADAASAAPAASAASAAEEPAAPPQMLHMVIAGSGKGTSALRLADRLQLASDLAMQMQMTVDTPDNTRMLMDLDMVLKAKGESLAKPAAAKAAAKKKP